MARTKIRKILFVCLKNASRSQMAEALAKMKKPRRVESIVRASTRAIAVHPNAVKAMRELGYDLTGHRCRHISAFKSTKFDVVAKMDVENLGDQVTASWVEHWLAPDPANGGIAEYRRARDLLAERVQALLDELSR